MQQSASSKLLFVSICSLTKAGGGHDEYDAGEAIASELTPRLARNLLWRRERVIPFGQALRDRLLRMSESELLALEPEHRMDGIVFRALPAAGSGLPEEEAAIAASQAEEDLVEAYAVEMAGEVLGGGNPESSASGRELRWRFAALWASGRMFGASRGCSSGSRTRLWRSARIR